MRDVTIIGFDFGMKRIGVAIGQSVTGKARPLTTLLAKDGIPDWQQIQTLIDEWQPTLLLVGAPYNHDGSEQTILHCAKKFANRLNAKFKMRIEMIDERYTSKHAKSLMRQYKTKNHSVDSMAAMIIVEDWLQKQTK